jgi:hypothetical protein
MEKNCPWLKISVTQRPFSHDVGRVEREKSYRCALRHQGYRTAGSNRIFEQVFFSMFFLRRPYLPFYVLPRQTAKSKQEKPTK